MKRFLILDFGFWIVFASATLFAQSGPALNPKSKIQNPKWETSSRAESARGARLFAKKDFAGAAKAFGKAADIAPAPLRDFNRGTAEIASGGREEGAAHLARALRDPKLRAAALFNRGNAALASTAFDYAIRDYRDVLRLEPDNAAAKRNLEIALAQRHARESAASSGRGQNPQSGAPQTKSPQAAPSAGAPSSDRGQANVDALLRSVQQQEQEELARMKMQRSRSPRVGW